jgi:hypothetical protein
VQRNILEAEFRRMSDRRGWGGRARRATAGEHGRERGARLAALALAGLLAGLALGGCGQSPKNLAASYLGDLQQFNYPACYAMLTAHDRAARTLKQFLGEIPMAPGVDPVWFRAILFNTRYEVGEPQVAGERAVVPVKVTMPDLPLWERTIDATVGPNESANAAADHSLQTGNYPKLTFEDAVVLVKEQHRWRVLADFARRDLMMDRHREVVAIYHSEDWPKADAAYQALLAALAKEPFTGSRGLEFFFRRELKAIEDIQGQLPASRAYIPKLVLSDVSVKESEARVPAIFGRITNAGDRGVDDVRMTVTWYAGRDTRRKVLYQESHNVIVTPIEFTGFSVAVLPFAPGETRNFGFELVAPPEIQQGSEPNLVVSSIIFSQAKAPLPKLAVPGPTLSEHGSPSASPSAAARPTPSAHATPPPRATPAAPRNGRGAHNSSRKPK